MNVNQKIWVGFGAVLALVGLGSTIGYLKSREAEAASTRLAREYFTAYQAAKTVDEEITLARVHEARFVDTKNEAEVALFRKSIASAKQLTTTVQEASQSSALDEAAADVAKRLDGYAATFARVHQLHVRRGLTPDKGLEGELRKAVHEVEAKVKEQGQADLNVLLLTARRHEKDYLLRGDPKYVGEIQACIESFAEQMKKLSLPAALQKQLIDRWAVYAAAFQSLVAGDQELKKASADLLREANEIEETVKQLAESCSKDIATAQATTLGQLGSGRRTVLIVGIASALVGGGMAVWIAFSLAALNRGIRRVGEQIATGSDEILAASGQLSHSSQSLATGSSEQAASLEETSASLEEMASMTRRNADNASRAKELATQTRTAADAGATEMQAMRGAMDAIKDSSDNIAKIIKTIDEIAFQTNILALNAAVEAARAGEAGMGFAVVADEVRSLAQRAAQSARETADKIETSIAKSEHGVALSRKVAASLDEILNRAREVDSVVAEIAQACAEQSQGITQVNTAVSHMDTVTQSNAASAEESASAAEELNAQASMLTTVVGDLLGLVGGASQRAAAEEAKPATEPEVKLPASPKTPLRAPAKVKRTAPPAAKREEALTFS